MKRQYSDFLEISPNFESVVDIAADRRNANLWREYIVGDDMDRLMEVLCESLGNSRFLWHREELCGDFHQAFDGRTARRD